MTRTTIAALALLIAAGCGERPVLTKDGVTEAEFRRDVYECHRDAFGGRTPYLGVVEEFAAERMQLRCMVDGKGYTVRK